MTNIINKALRCLLPILFLLIAFDIANAQSIPAENKLGLRAPKNIKIDGKLTEWNGKLKEYSSHTQFYYAVSNDDKYLYLTIQATDDFIINRILKGGITFTVNKTDTKKDPDGIHICYPVIDYYRVHQKDAPKIKKGMPTAGLDSFVNVVNTQLEQKIKMIRVAGIKDVDTLISVYNLDGIKAASQIDDKIRYNYEIAVSLQNLGLDINKPVKFMYQVMINEVGAITHTYVSADGIRSSVSGGDRLGGQDATDFWGEYTLAK